MAEADGSGAPEPPRFTEAVLRRVAPPEVSGDLREGFRRRAEQAGVGRARAWYRRQARSHFVRAPAHLSRTIWRIGNGGMMGRDVLYAIRSLGRRPTLAAVMVATLALAIGANATVFSLWNALFERPLPVEEPHRLVGVYGSQPQGLTAASFQGFLPVSWHTVRDLRETSSAFSGVYVSGLFPVSLSQGDDGQRALALYTSAGYFDILGVRPALGRGFRAEEDDAPGAAAVVVLSHSFWTEHFGADPGVIGTSIAINGLGFTVVGVGPEGFQGTSVNASPDLWIPITMFSERQDWGAYLEERSARLFFAGARLAPGATLEDAARDARRSAEVMAEAFPDTYGTQSLQIVPMSDAAVTPNLKSAFYGGTVAIMTLAGLVLLIACMNVGNLLLARALGREREMAIRTSVGAGRTRLVAQLLTETLVLFTIGGGLGVLLAAWAQSALSGLRPPLLGGNGLDLRLDLPVLLFTTGLTLAAALAFGLLPALRASRTDVATALREGRSQGLSGGGWARSALVVGQVGLSVVALVAAGLFLRGLDRAASLDLGFQPEGVGTLSIDLADQGYEPEEGRVFYRRLMEEVDAIPGINQVALAQYRPLDSSALMPVAHQGVPFVDPSTMTYVRLNPVTPSYASTMGLRVEQGRWLGPSDAAEDPAVIVVNRFLAETMWPGEDAVGKVLQVGPDGHEATVVGVVPTGRYVTLEEDPQPAVYTSMEQTYPGEVTVFVRGEGSALGGGEAATVPPLETVRRTIESLDPALPVFDMEPASHLVDQALWNTRALAYLMVAFGGVGLLLAALGVYGVVSNMVRERRRELGLRLALGAEPGQVVRRALSSALGLVATGAAVGTGLGFVFGARIEPQLHGVSASDPVTYLLVVGSLLTVSTVAAWIPARRAARVDPLEALRAE